MPRVRTGPLIGLIFQLMVLAALDRGVGLGAAGWCAGAACGLVTFGALQRALTSTGNGLGPADHVTLARTGLAGGVAALTADGFTGSGPVGVLCALSAVALALDAVDGQVARRTGTASELGARFDMEADAWLILVLSVHVAQTLGSWVLLIGSMRYLLAAATWLLPWLRGPVPPRYWRKVVAAMQGVTLAVAASGLLPVPVAGTVVAIALVFLIESFGSEVWGKWRRQVRAVAVAAS